MNAIAAVNSKAREAVQGVLAWVDLGIMIIERLALLGIVVLLFAYVDGKFAIFNLPLPSADMWQLLGATAVWAMVSGRISVKKLVDILFEERK